MRELIERVRLALEALDVHSESVEAASGLRCVSGCGACCNSPDVEATVLELLPFAFELLQRGDAGEWHARALEAEGKPCVIYRPDPWFPERGRCSEYTHRAAICRLFGSTARRARDGARELVTCRVRKEALPDAVESARALLAADPSGPTMAELARTITSLDPSVGAERMPINLALARAIERVGLWWDFEGGGDDDEPLRAA